MSEIICRLAVESDVLTLAEMRWTWRTGEERARARVSREDYLDECSAFLRQGLLDVLSGDYPDVIQRNAAIADVICR